MQPRSPAPPKAVRPKQASAQPRCKSYTPADLAEAARRVAAKEITLTQAMNLYDIPRSTLEAHVKLAEKGLQPAPSGRPPYFGDIEPLLASWIIASSRAGRSPTALAVRSQALRLAVERHKPNPKRPSYHWFQGFLRRNPSVSGARASKRLYTSQAAATRPNLNTFYENVRLATAEDGYDASIIFNMDETGFGKFVYVVMSVESRSVLSDRGSVRANWKVYGARGDKVKPVLIPPVSSHVTVCCAASAGGFVLPPYFLFKGIIHVLRDSQLTRLF